MRITTTDCKLICCWQGKELVGTVAISPKGVLVTGPCEGNAQVSLAEASKLVPAMANSILPDDYEERQNLQKIIKKSLFLKTNAGNYPVCPHTGPVRKFEHSENVKRYVDAEGNRCVVGTIKEVK
jgi:hypothetical protein